MKNLFITVTLLTLSFQSSANTILDYANYKKAVNKVASMYSQESVRSQLKKYGLDILNVTWEDTGRAQGSSMGPNISDMTIQAHIINEKGDIKPVAMPVIRYPNFADKTADLSPSKFSLLVGNEKGDALKKITLTEYLDNFKKYLSLPESWDGNETSLLAARDTHVLVSAQMTMLPVPKGGTAHFNPVLFNYQSSEKNPAVLAIIATREGTSATIIDNKRDTFDSNGMFGGWGQRLFFNTNGQKASFTAKRLSEALPTAAQQALKAANSKLTANDQAGSNMVLLIQVPLKHKQVTRIGMPMFALESVAAPRSMEDALIGHGPVEGPFVEIDDLKIERDDRFPIRVTVQFYKATDSAELTADNAKEFRQQIDKVYKKADYVGSLVTEGETGRPTSHNVPYLVKPIWWPVFWPVFLEDTGMSESDALIALEKTYGPDWIRMTSSEEKFQKALDIATKK